MEAIPTILFIIDNDTEEELMREQDNPFSLPEYKEIHDLIGKKIVIANKERTIVEANTEPVLNDECDMVGVNVILRVE